LNAILPKKTLRKLKTYRPAVTENKDIDVIRLSVNEGALGPSPLATQAIEEWSTKKHFFHRYPDQIDQNLIEAISNRYNLQKQNIVLGNGSDDLIQLICNAFLDSDDEAIHTEFGFLVFPQSIKIAGGKAVCAEDKNYTVSIHEILEKITHKTKLIFLANPNNPTGTMVNSNEINALIKSLRSDIILVIDAAYAEYVENDLYIDGTSLVEKYNNVIMLRTFSKLHGLASLRLGWAYCPLLISNLLKSIRPAFSVNALASFAGTASIQDIEFQKKSFLHNKKLRNWTFQQLSQVEIDFIPSVANFFLINLKSEKRAEGLLKYLEDRKIYVRGMQPYNLNSFLRVSIGTEFEMKKFLKNTIDFSRKFISD